MTEPMKLAAKLKQYEGQPVAILCARYWYRGVLKELGADYVLLKYPRAVEVTGSAQSERPEREDPIPSDLMIRIDFMEIVCQPTWVTHDLSEEDQKAWDERKERGEKHPIPEVQRQR